MRKCEAKVRCKGVNFYRTRRCKNKGSLQVDGHWFCRHHTPKVLLECYGFKYDTLKSVQVVKDIKQNLTLIEYHYGDIQKSAEVSKKDLKEGPLRLTPLYHHERRLIRNRDGIWMLEYGSGTRTSIKCKE